MDVARTIPSAHDLGHAYIVVGGAAASGSIEAHLGDLGIPRSGNPDVTVDVHDVFGIEDAKRLRERVGRRTFGTGRRVCIVVCTQMTKEAQHALLKTLEEPQVGTTFFFVVPALDGVLATLLSRTAGVINAPAGADDVADIPIDAAAFMAASPAERLAMLEDIIARKDARAALATAETLERALARLPHSSERSAFLRALYDTRRYMRDRGASLKVLLESLAVRAPRIS